MLRLITPDNTNRDKIEAQIAECKQIKHDIDVLNAKYDKLKSSLIESYFNDNQEFVGSEGLILATYKTQKRSSFNSVEFKKDHINLYQQYVKEQEIKVFLLK